MQFGYGTKKYTFENGQIKTATEYIGAKQDAMQELNKKIEALLTDEQKTAFEQMKKERPQRKR